MWKSGTRDSALTEDTNIKKYIKSYSGDSQVTQMHLKKRNIHQKVSCLHSQFRLITALSKFKLLLSENLSGTNNA